MSLNWFPSFDYATLYSPRKFDLDLFQMNCICIYMPLGGSQFKENDLCHFYLDGEWVRVTKVGNKKMSAPEVSTYAFSEFKKYFKVN